MLTAAPRSAALTFQESTMANHAPAQPEAPRPWYAGLIGFVFAAIVLGAVGLATAASYDNQPDDHGSESSEEGDHSEDVDPSEDADHSE